VAKIDVRAASDVGGGHRARERRAPAPRRAREDDRRPRVRELHAQLLAQAVERRAAVRRLARIELGERLELKAARLPLGIRVAERRRLGGRPARRRGALRRQPRRFELAQHAARLPRDRARGFVALGSRLGHAPPDDPHAGDRHASGELRWRHDLLALVRGAEAGDRGTVERRPAGEQVVVGGAERVQVGGDGRRLAAPDLGREVVRGAGADVGLRRAQRRDRHAEVAELRGTVGLDQDVAGLDVAMDDARGVGELERRGQLQDHRRGLLGGERAVARHHHLRGYALDVLHRDVAVGTVTRDAVDLDDRRVVELRDAARLGEEPGLGIVFGWRPGQHLDRRRAQQRLVGREVHDTHISSPEHSQ